MEGKVCRVRKKRVDDVLRVAVQLNLSGVGELAWDVDKVCYTQTSKQKNTQENISAMLSPAVVLKSAVWCSL